MLYNLQKNKKFSKDLQFSKRKKQNTILKNMKIKWMKAKHLADEKTNKSVNID